MEVSMTSVDRVIPLLVYEDISAAHDFLVEAFGFESVGIYRGSDGEVFHAEVRAGTTPIWLHRVAPEHQVDSPRQAGMSSSGLVVLVDDVDEHFRRASAAGAHIQCEPVDQSYGQREYGAWDHEGHRWWFATPFPEHAAPSP
jgi:MerR family transcriptional regulator, thiopeptide resistance regulator